MRNYLSKFLDDPSGLDALSKKGSYFYLTLSIVLIFLTPILLYVELVSPVLYNKYLNMFLSMDLFIITFFLIDLSLRLISADKKLSYIFSINGFIDIISVVPEFLSMVFGLGINSAWLRVLRLFRVGKIVSTHKGTGILSGFTGVVLIISAGIISAKVLILILESYGYIPIFDNISLVLGLVSFSLAMLLGTKLSVVNGRLNQLEDAITRIVAGIKVFWFTDTSSRKCLQNWVCEFYKCLKNPDQESVSNMRRSTNALYDSIGKNGIDPNLVGFSRDVAFVLNTSLSEVNPFYEKFLKEVTFVFTIVIVTTVPGITGLVASLILSYIFFGMFYLIEDMDNPLDYGEESLITVNLNPLEEMIDNLDIESR
jgi:hypothetical protein